MFRNPDHRGIRDDDRKGTILASCSTADLRKRPAAPRDIFDFGPPPEDFEVLSKAERAHYRRIRGY